MLLSLDPFGEPRMIIDYDVGNWRYRPSPGTGAKSVIVSEIGVWSMC